MPVPQSAQAQSWKHIWYTQHGATSKEYALLWSDRCQRLHAGFPRAVVRSSAANVMFYILFPQTLTQALSETRFPWRWQSYSEKYLCSFCLKVGQSTGQKDRALLKRADTCCFSLCQAFHFYMHNQLSSWRLDYMNVPFQESSAPGSPSIEAPVQITPECTEMFILLGIFLIYLHIYG